MYEEKADSQSNEPDWATTQIMGQPDFSPRPTAKKVHGDGRTDIAGRSGSKSGVIIAAVSFFAGAVCFGAIGAVRHFGETRRVAMLRDAQTQIEANYALMNAATLSKNVKVVTDMLATDYIYVSETGQINTRPEISAVLQKAFRESEPLRATTKIDKFFLKGDRAGLVVRNKVDWLTRDSKGVKRHVQFESIMQDKWVRSGAGWRQRSSRMVSQSARSFKALPEDEERARRNQPPPAIIPVPADKPL